MYSSSWAGRKTHASWKKGFLLVSVVERRRDWVGEGPIIGCSSEEYWIIVRPSPVFGISKGLLGVIAARGGG